MAPIIRGSSLYVTVDGPSWTQAEANAVKLGGHLVTINTAEEDQYLKNTLSNRTYFYQTNTPGSDLWNINFFWIGLSDKQVEGQWQWSSGEPLAYVNWGPGMPNNNAPAYPNHDYVVIGYVIDGREPLPQSGYWDDFPNTAAEAGWNTTSSAYKGIAEIPLSISLNRDANPKEGAGSFTTSINLTAGTQSGIINGATIYWQISGITSDDFLSGSLTGVGTINNGKLEITHSLKVDSDTGEILNLSVFSDSSYTQQIGSTLSASIIEADPTYSLSPSATSIDEGSTLTSTVSTTNVASGTALYYSLSGTGITTADFSSGSLTGSGTVSSSGSFSFSHTLANDLTTEGTETLEIKLYSDTSRSTQVASTSVSISDTSRTPTYSLSPSATSIDEGSTLTTIVSTTNVASGTSLYYSLSGTGINTADFSSGSLTGSGTVSSGGSFSLSHTLANDLTTEGSETLQIRLFTDSDRSNQVASASVSINDTSITPPTLPSYLLTPSATTINEGSLVSTTITTTNVASGTTLYWSAVGSGITTSDFSFGALSGSASIGSDGKATFSYVLANDLSTEGSETLNILLYSDSNRSNQVATTSIAINDTSIAPATPTVAVSGNNTGVINTGTINNSGTINSGTINTNSGNTTNTTTNTSNVTVGPTIINNITNTTTNTTSVLSNTSYPSYNVNNTWANNLVTGAITGSAPTLAKNSFDYKFYNLGGGRYGVQEKGSSKIDEITGASSLKFADQTLTPANDVAATFNQVKGKDDVSGVVFRLYNAAFSRLPDAKGLENWINGNAAGTVTYASSAQSFSESQEFKNRYGSNVTDTQFITTLYNNVLGRAPDAGGLSHYQSLLAGGRSRGALLLDFSESPENRVLFTQVTGLA